MKSRSSLLAVFLLLVACNKQNVNPIAADELVLKPPTGIQTMFPSFAKFIPVEILSSNVSSINPVSSYMSYDYFEILGVGYSDDSHTKLNVVAWGRRVTPTPMTIQYSVRIGDASCTIPITIEVQDFYFASSFDTNVSGDTIRIPRGGNFLLQITCRDSLGNKVSRSEIQRHANPSWSLNYYLGYPKFTVSSAYRDTLSFYYMFAAFPDIVPDADDLRYGFTFELSNKQLHMPIRITY